MKREASGRHEFHLEATPAPEAPRPVAARKPFEIAIFGDFSGAGGILHEDSPLEAVQIDRDDVDQVLRRHAPVVSVEGETGRVTITFDTIWDFEPGELYERLQLFRMMEDRAKGGSSPSGATSPPPPPGPESGAGLLDDVLLASGAEPEAPSRRPPAATPGDLQDFIDRALEPHLIRETASDAERRRILHAAVTTTLREILKAPAFRSVEALWRGVDLLCRRLDTGPLLKLHVVDSSKAMLEEDLRRSASVSASRTGRFLTDPSESGGRFALLVACYEFGPEDLELLSRMGELGALANAPWIGEAAPGLAAVAMAGEAGGGQAAAWSRLRESVEARYLSLVLPRVMLRLPYGPDNPTEPEYFAECEGTPGHEDYLWGSPALFAALALAAGFSSHAWQLRPGAHVDVSGLPLHVVTDTDGQSMARPSAEALIGEDEARLFMDSGLTPLLAFKDRDRIRVPGVHPLSATPFPLAGKWLDAHEQGE